MTNRLSLRFAPVSLRRRAVALAIAVSVIGVPTAIQVVPAYAASNSQKKAEINKKISALREDANEASADEADLLGRLDEINNRKSDVEGQISALQPQIDQVQRELDAANVKLKAAEAEVKRSEDALAAAQAQLAANTERLQEQAVDAYIGKEPTQAMSKAVTDAKDLSEASAASAYMRQIVSDRRDVVEEKRELEGQARDLNKQLEALRASAENERGAIAQHEGELATQKGQLDGLSAQVQQEADAQNKLLAEAESKRSQFEAQIAGLQAESDNIGNILRGGGGGGSGVPADSGPTPPPGRGVLSNPVPGAKMTSPFGTRVHPIFGTTRLHAGQDYGVAIGTTLRAAGDGTVATAGVVSGYGNYTCIKHSGGIASCYAHQSQILVSVGQKVTRGQVIGKSGNTGNSTGPHLHFEVRVNGTPVDPRGYL